MVIVGATKQSFAVNKDLVDSLKTLIKYDKLDTVKVNHLNSLAYLFRNAFPDSTIILSQQSIKICEHIVANSNLKIWSGYSNALGNLGIGYRLKGELPLAKEYYFKALEMDRKLQYQFGIGKRLVGIANFYDDIGNFSESLKYSFEALKVNQKIKNERAVALSYGIIGNVYNSLSNYKLALNYELKALEIFEKINDLNNIESSLAGLGLTYINLKEYDKSINCLKRALVIAEDNKQMQEMGETLNFLGLAYLAMNQKPQALNYFSEALSINTENKIRNGIAVNNNYIAQIYIENKQYKEAEELLKVAQQIDIEIGAKSELLLVELNLAKLYEETKRNNEALRCYKVIYALQDSINNKANNQKILVLEIEKKEAEEKIIQEKKDAIAKQELQKQKIVRNSLVGGFILILIIAIGVFRSLQQNRNAKALIEEQKKIVEHKNQEITDSIEYAKRIQFTLLASNEILQQNLPEHFLLFQPKDIVSGDFYWATKKGNRFYLAVCDSTGHGVPGAFMSLLNATFLNEAINEKNIAEPHQILNHVRQRLVASIGSDGAQDGMDCTLLCFDTTSNHITYSAANHKPILILNNQLVELEGDKIPVGKSEKMEIFKLRTIPTYLENESSSKRTLYLFTDGYADQFGGPKAKKYSKGKFKELLLRIQHLPMNEQREALYNAHIEWRSTQEQVDDICVIGVRV